MSKNRVFGRPMPDANVPREAFDLSKRINMQLPFGAIIPCYAHQALAGSRFQIGVESFFRTAAVNTAAFPRLKMETEFFCVPLRYLWSYWDNFKLGINDFNSTALMNANTGTAIQPTSVPNIDVYQDLWPLLANATALDPLSFDWKYGARRLADMLGYGRYNDDFSQTDTSAYVQKVSLFKAAAYQKVYYDHFRNTAYEVNDPFAYNLDCLSSSQNTSTANVLQRLFTLRYANYRKDYFQSIFPGLNYISSNTINNSSIPSWIQGLVKNSATPELISASASSGGQTYDRPASSTNGSFFSVQGLRALFALDKLNRASAYAPQHVKNQYEARYGIKFSSASSYESQKIGSFDTDVIIGEVTSTANTITGGGTGDALGAIGGKGIGSRSNTNMISYDVKEDSIIIGVCYAIPRTSYDSYRFDNWNMKLSRNDFFIPEFMNLGLKPLYKKEFQNAYYDDTLGYYVPRSVSSNNDALGYQLPYMEYKCDIDENHGLFADVNMDLGQFVVHTNAGGITGAASGVSARYFKVNPKDLDSIFVNQADGREVTDHLFGELTFRVPVNQNMSVHGVPTL